jgi:hypothetical protein
LNSFAHLLIGLFVLLVFNLELFIFLDINLLFDAYLAEIFFFFFFFNKEKKFILAYGSGPRLMVYAQGLHMVTISLWLRKAHGKRQGMHERPGPIGFYSRSTLEISTLTTTSLFA